MIAARRRDDPVRRAAFPCQPADIDQPTSNLEGADRRVVLVLHPELGANALAKQRPAILRSRRKGALHLTVRLFQLPQ